MGNGKQMLRLSLVKFIPSRFNMNFERFIPSDLVAPEARRAFDQRRRALGYALNHGYRRLRCPDRQQKQRHDRVDHLRRGIG